MIVLKVFACIIIGYLFGCLSPAAVISKYKKKNLKELGTKNLGTMNVALVIGKLWGLLVMCFDILKAWAAFKLCDLIFAELQIAGFIAGASAIIGHIFPFYLKFKGGKGLAAFGGMILGFDYRMFLILLFTCFMLVLLVNYSFIMPYSGAVLFCVGATVMTHNIFIFFITAICGAIIIWKHFGNLKKALNGTDIKVREYIKCSFFGSKKSEGWNNNIQKM